VAALKRFADKRHITFPLLSDPDHRVIEAFGVRNREADGTRIAGVPYPGVFLIDRAGVIRAKLFYEGYRQRHHSDQILAAFTWKKPAQP
jgi:peroxiredoxin